MYKSCLISDGIHGNTSFICTSCTDAPSHDQQGIHPLLKLIVERWETNDAATDDAKCQD